MKQLTPQFWNDVTPSDSTAIGQTIGLYIGGAGTVKAKGVDGVIGTFICQAGQYLIGNFSYVMATGTTATSIVALRS
jgi:hypothetical protein